MAEGFALKGKSKSKWLAYYMGIRSAVFDSWLSEKMAEMADAAVIHIGCGMDSRILRVGAKGHKWYDVDFPEVITERRRYYTEDENYSMIAGDASNGDWLNSIPESQSAIVVMEGISMYLSPDELKGLTKNLSDKFRQSAILMDCYSEFAARMSKYKNPVKDVGVSLVWGLDNPESLNSGDLRFVTEHTITPQKYIDELRGMEKRIFEKLYAGSFAKKLYKLYEYKK